MELQVGDVVNLEKGHKVYGKIPEKFAYSNRRMSNKLVSTEIEIGSLLKNELDPKEKINGMTNEIIELFELNLGAKIDKETTREFVRANITYSEETYDTSQLAGEYVVIKAYMTGGGCGHGPGDVYPDGWEVTCKKLKNEEWDDEGLEVRFYQSGCFTSMIKEIETLRKMKMGFK